MTTLSADGATALIGADQAKVGVNTYQGAAYVFANDELVVNFGASGLWQYRNGAWSELTSLTPGMMAAYANDMVALFPGAGLYQNDGFTWLQLTPISSIDQIVGMPDRVYVDFPGRGLWQYHDASWTIITGLSPNHMLAFGDKLLANFPGAGLYQYDGATWRQITPISTADIIIAGASEVYVDFPSAGLYAYNGSSWTGLTSLNPNMMTIYAGILTANFPSHGVYLYAFSSWTQLTPTVAQGMIGTSTSSTGLYVNFGAYGIYEYSGGWTHITQLSPNLMGSMGSSLIANFSPGGLWAYNGSAWSQLTPLSSSTATLGVTWP